MLMSNGRLRLAALLAFAVAGTNTACADYNSYVIHTVQWLVDNSDTILILDGSDGGLREGKVVSVLKGDAKTLVYPLNFEQRNYTSLSPPSKGPRQLIYVKGKSQKLQVVALGRLAPMYAKLHGSTYGYSQFGDLYLTERDLMTAIVERMKQPPGKPMQTIANKTPQSVLAPPDFPLETTYETFSLYVPFDHHRRDHYIQELRTGNAVARIQALNELANFDDDLARRAIRKATKATDVVPASEPRVWNPHSRAPEMWTTQHVRKRAEQLLERIGDES